MRLTRAYDPWVCAAWVDGRRVPVPTGMRLSRLLARQAGHIVDLDVELVRGQRRVGFRVVALPGRESTMTRLCTNLPRTPFSADLVGRLYRFRWQIERDFKEWKSYANLHQFDTANPHIAVGLRSCLQPGRRGRRPRPQPSAPEPHAALPDRPHGILRNQRIGRHDGQAKGDRLGDEHAVEGIAVQRRQADPLER